MKLELQKLEDGKAALKLSLAKAGINTPPAAEVGFVLDVSGSFDDEHRDGSTQRLLERLVPWGMVFDPDQKLDVFTFSSDEGRAHYVGELTPATTENYIGDNIIARVPGYNLATEYSYVLEKTLQHFGWLSSPSDGAAPAKKGLLGRMFGGAASAATPATPTKKRRTVVIFVTDGENSDKVRTQQVLSESQKRGDEVYFLFIGISNQGGNFPFLQQIADRFDNTGIAVINDFGAFLRLSDAEINDQLVGDELVTWLKK